MAKIINKNIPYLKMRELLKEQGLDESPSKGFDKNAYYDIGVIKKEDLESGSYYWGICRNSEIAMWDKDCNSFWYMRTKCPDFKPFIDSINHLEDDDGYDLFIPLSKIELEEDCVSNSTADRKNTFDFEIKLNSNSFDFDVNPLN